MASAADVLTKRARSAATRGSSIPLMVTPESPKLRFRPTRGQEPIKCCWKICVMWVPSWHRAVKVKRLQRCWHIWAPFYSVRDLIWLYKPRIRTVGARPGHLHFHCHHQSLILVLTDGWGDYELFGQQSAMERQVGYLMHSRPLIFLQFSRNDDPFLTSLCPSLPLLLPHHFCQGRMFFHNVV